jgi:hypothetical protein
MRNVMILVLLMSLCVPTLAQTGAKMETPDLVGKWTGVLDVIGWDKKTAWMPNETVSFWPEGKMTLTIEEMKGRMFAGKITPSQSPNSVEVVLGVLSSDNESIAMVDENGYYWVDMISPTEIELFYQEVDMEGMEVANGIFTKA